ncbi:MAG: GNAT family N-acetyltransferase [Leptolinea sp.]|nr:GNAT family N-acetyltransferase [Leptolinea sp.]
MIRQLIPAVNETDYHILLPAYLELINSPEALKYLSYTGIPFTQEMVSSWLKTHLDAGIDYYADFSEDRRIQGIVVTKSNSLSGFELLGLAVRAINRERGVGKGLVRYVMNRAVESGFASVDVTVFADNIPMLRLLLGQGFIPVSMTYHVRFDGADAVNFKLYV